MLALQFTPMPFGVHIGSCSTSCHRRPSPPCWRTRDEVLVKPAQPGLVHPGLAPACKCRGCNEATKEGAAADAAAAAAAEEAEAAEAAEAEPYCTTRSFQGTKTH